MGRGGGNWGLERGAEGINNGIQEQREKRSGGGGGGKRHVKKWVAEKGAGRKEPGGREKENLRFQFCAVWAN